MQAARRIEFDIRTPVADDRLAFHVASCLERGLPEVEYQAPRIAPLTVLANGPSAKRAALDGDVLALNGALKVCLERGVVPKYWAACDPQEMVADFLKDAPDETTYLVCSKCHPKVFDALEGKKVLVWHLDDAVDWGNPIVSAVSITLVAFELMERLGYSAFETWGWDGCYVDGESHAAPQAHGGSDITMLVGDKRYLTTTTWAAEAQDAVNLFKAMPHQIVVRGGGMLGAILNFHGVDGVKVED